MGAASPASRHGMRSGPVLYRAGTCAVPYRQYLARQIHRFPEIGWDQVLRASNRTAEDP